LLCPALPGGAADFDGDSREDIAVYRPSSGKWLIRGITQVFFGTAADTPVAGDFSGDGIAEVGIFRPSSGLWRIRNTTLGYFGTSTDVPITGGGSGQRLYDYVVRTGDGDDLAAALESDVYRSVFIPAGTYSIDQTVTIEHVRKIVGEEQRGTVLAFDSGCYLDIHVEFCKVDGLRVLSGGGAGGTGNVYVRSNYVTVRDCFSYSSEGHGFEHGSGAYVSFIDCVASNAAANGFQGSNDESCRFLNCAARDCAENGFEDCNNLANCYIDGYGHTQIGFYDCDRLSNCYAYGCQTYGFSGCNMAGACLVDGGGITTTGFHSCYRLSSCWVQNCTGSSYDNVNVSDDSTNKYSCN